MTDPRTHHPEDDVAAARDGVRRAGVRFGAQPPPRLPRDRGSWMRDFVARYGWRAYALPVLVVVTVIAMMTSSATTHTATHTAKARPATGSTGPAAAPSQLALKDDAPGANADNTALKGYALPHGLAYTAKGTGSFRVLKGTSPVVGRSGPLFRYSIDVENGVTGIDLARFQQEVVSVLADPRSWSGHGVRLQRVDSATADFHITMTSSLTVRKFCGYSIPVETSCYASAGSDGSPVNRVIFNDARWMRGSTAYVGDLAAYRIYMINHEDGHALGHQHAHACLPDGLAPAMMQQTFGLRSAKTGKLCGANPWPYPPGATGAPGAESADTAANDEYAIGD